MRNNNALSEKNEPLTPELFGNPAKEYRVAFEIAEPGRHIIEIKAFGSRVNTFGQLHHVCCEGVWWGPGSWRTEGSEWTYEYHIRPQGILKSPELFNA